jgi:hypothetical protein
MKFIRTLSLFLVIAASAANAQVINGSTTTATSTLTAGVASNSSVTFNGKRNTPAVLAPGLTAAGIETCLGSNSVGGAGPGFGVTIAGTTTDRGCNLRLYSRTLYSMGHKLAATQILCNDPDVAAALALEGVRCLVGPAAEAAARGLANARAEAEAAPVAGSVARAPCRNWVLFRGCLDEPEPDAAGMTAAPVLDPPRGRTKLTTAENRSLTR